MKNDEIDVLDEYLNVNVPLKEHGFEPEKNMLVLYPMSKLEVINIYFYYLFYFYCLFTS